MLLHYNKGLFIITSITLENCWADFWPSGEDFCKTCVHRTGNIWRNKNIALIVFIFTIQSSVLLVQSSQTLSHSLFERYGDFLWRQKDKNYISGLSFLSRGRKTGHFSLWIRHRLQWIHWNLWLQEQCPVSGGGGIYSRAELSASSSSRAELSASAPTLWAAFLPEASIWRSV